MVGIVDIVLNENRSAELGLTDNQIVTAGNGVRYKWAGAAWVVDDNNGVSGVRNGSMANREMSAGLTNLGRQQNGLPPLTFGGDGRPVPQNQTASPDPSLPRVNVATMDPDELFDENDLTRGERRQLSRTGRIQRNGMNFTRQDIRAMGQRLSTIRTRRGERIDAERRPTMDDYRNSKRAIDRMGRRGVLGTILSLGTGMGALSTFRQALLDVTTENDRRLAEINQNSNLSAEQKAQETADALSQYYQAQSAIFMAQLVPTVVALYGGARGIRNSARAVGVIVRAYRLALQSGAQLASVAGGPVAFLGTLAVNAAIFVLTEVGMYFAIRWMMRTDTGQALMFGFLQSEMLKIASETLGPFAANVNAHVENSIAPIMDRIQSGAADALEFTNDMVMSNEFEREAGRETADRLRREWDRQTGSNRNIQGPDTSGENFRPPSFD